MSHTQTLVAFPCYFCQEVFARCSTYPAPSEIFCEKHSMKVQHYYAYSPSIFDYPLKLNTVRFLGLDPLYQNMVMFDLNVKESLLTITYYSRPIITGEGGISIWESAPPQNFSPETAMDFAVKLLKMKAFL